MTQPISKAKLWTGRVLSGISILFLSMGVIMNFAQPKEAVEGTKAIGFPIESMMPIGAVLLVCLILYAIPRTAPIGALFLTAYLGGAVATHVRLGDPLFTTTFAPVYFALFVWIGLGLRDRRVQALLAPEPN